MPNQITSTGLQTKTYSELLADFTASLQAIYGADINISQDTPDGQLINIFIQAILDNLDLLTQVYNNFDPDKAFGTTLDQRVAYNGIQRLAGTRTITNISVTVALGSLTGITLKGVDLNPDDPYTISDNAGNEFELITTQNITANGVYVYDFRAKNIGAVYTIPNTITNPVTIVLGVDAVNNPTTYTSLGINEETDAQLKVRRQISVSLSSQGYRSSLLAALLNINGITGAYVYENNSDSVDVDGTDGHTIWVIASGGTPVEIADAIYRKRNAGCGLRGAQTYAVTQPNGSEFIVRWDNVVTESLFIAFDASSLDGVTSVNTVEIQSQLPNLFVPNVYEQVNINDLATIVQQIDPNCLVTNAGFSLSLGGPYTAVLSPSAKNKQFSVTSGNINITVV